MTSESKWKFGTQAGDPGADRKTALLLFLVAVGIRLIAMSLSDNEDGDAMARVIHARLLVDRGDLVPSSVWLPGHFLFLAGPYLLGLKDQLYAISLTLLVSALSVPLTFYLVKDFLGRKAAVLAGILLALYALHIRFSIVTVAEGPAWTFSLAGILMFFRYVKNGRLHELALGCLSMGVAASMRLEAWLLPGAFVVGALVRRFFVKSETVEPGALFRIGVYALFSLAFPIFWMSYCYVTYGDPFHLQMEIVRTANLRPASLGYALAFWPGLMLFSMGPVVMLIAVCGYIHSLLTKRTTIEFLVFTSAFLVLLLTGYGRYVHARYGFSLMMVMLLFVGPGVEALSRFGYAAANERWLMRLVPASACLWLIIMPIISSSNLGWVAEKMASVSPLPRFERRIVETNQWLATNQGREGSIVLHGKVGPSAAWLSLADKWYDIQIMDRYIDRQRDKRQLYFSSSFDNLVSIVQGNSRGHLVLPFESSAELKREWRRRLVDTYYLSEEPVFSNDRFAVFRWGSFPNDPSS